MELYTPTHDPSMPLEIRWILKGLSQFADTSTAMQDQGFPAVATLGEAHMLLWDTVPTGSKWSAVDESQEITQLVQRKTVTNNIQQTFADLSVDEMMQVLVRKQFVTNNYTHSFAINGNIVTSLTLAGLYLQSLGGTSYRLGVTDAQPVITIQGGSNVTLQADATGTYTDQGATAQASDGPTLSVTQSGDTVNLAQITAGSPYVIVFSALDAFGNLNSATRTVHVVDATNPSIIALPTSDGQVNPVTMLQGGTIVPAVNTLAGY